VRVVVVHYEAEEAVALAARLRREGIDAEPCRQRGSPILRELRIHPPDAVVIDLMRMPSYGRAIGAVLREQKSTRSIPLVFLAGDPEKTERVRELLPDAGFATLPKLGVALRKAVERPPVAPVVPDSRGTPLAKKLRIQSGARVGVVGAPPGFEIGGLPAGATVRSGRDGDVVLIFVKSLPVLAREMRSCVEIVERSTLWIVWPKVASGASGGVSMKTINEACATVGLVGYKALAVDETWSAVVVAKRRR
jgi:CheY-like chemotaxis protein